VVHHGSILVWPEETRPWGVAAADAVTAASLEAVVHGPTAVEILLLGCGREFGPRPRDLAADLKAAGIVLEWMDTGAACRTFNVLLSEERPVAAALIAVD